VVDTNLPRASEQAALYGAEPLADAAQLAGKVDAAIVAAPTHAHAEIGCMLAAAGIDVLVEKPIAPDLAFRHPPDRGRRSAMAAFSRWPHRAVQPGGGRTGAPRTLPLFFEIHRLNMFSRAAWMWTWCWTS